jgi:hypothetical protein
MINNKMLLLIGGFLLTYSMNVHFQSTAAGLETFFPLPSVIKGLMEMY